MRILLGVTGCIADYKSCEILRGLQKAGADVEVVMTESAAEFVTPTTFSALSGHPVRTGMFGDMDDPIPHIRLAEGCDLFLIAPCTGNVLAKIANGIADDLLTSCALAAHDHLAVAPAMNVHMYESPATQANIETLKGRGVHIIEPGSGYLACGDVGKGRLAEEADIVEAAIGIVESEGAPVVDGPLAGDKVLVTAGPTIERIDAVRYLTNDSSGKMGYAIAEAARDMGAEVTLVSGPVSLGEPRGVNTIHVESAQEMLDAAKGHFDDANIAIFAAAVSDVRPERQYGEKLKKGKDDKALRKIRTIENPDILATLASMKKDGQYIIGFAAETEDLLKSARAKLSSKNADMIVANEVGDGKAFGQDDDKATLVMHDSEVDLPKMQKTELAKEILSQACANIS